MSGKIPVGATIGSAHHFAFGNIVNYLGVIWIRALILLAVSFFFNAAFTRVVSAFAYRARLSDGVTDPASATAA